MKKQFRFGILSSLPEREIFGESAIELWRAEQARLTERYGAGHGIETIVFCVDDPQYGPFWNGEDGKPLPLVPSDRTCKPQYQAAFVLREDYDMPSKCFTGIAVRVELEEIW